MLDEDEFLSPHGIRSVSRYHADHPYTFDVGGQDYRVLPAGGVRHGHVRRNSNWRGPVWFPMNALLIRALLNLYVFYGDEFTVECPTGSGQQMTLYRGRRGDRDRLTRHLPAGTPTAAARSRRAGRSSQRDPHWRDLLLFYEYFHGDNGAGIGASHQTGWTGLVALTATLAHSMAAEGLLADGLEAAFRRRPGAAVPS